MILAGLPVGLGLAAAASIDLSFATPSAFMAWAFGVIITSPAAAVVEGVDCADGVALPPGEQT